MAISNEAWLEIDNHYRSIYNNQINSLNENIETLKDNIL